ncbi:uncharacterized protein LOC112557741 [Pomacea canaliculata]|nr:uncharacterized protein LOC112557741 [Pomacea canaliculata]
MSFKLLINGKKIEAETDLWPIIQSHSNCTIVVEQSTKIEIDIVTSTGTCSEDANQKVLISRFKYEKVDTLKKEVCDQLQMPLHCIDLYHNDNHLKDNESLRSSRLRNKDQIKAVVLRNRIWLKIRMVRCKSKWVDIEVDDQTLTTVGHLKAFARSQLVKIATESPSDVLDSNQECSSEFPIEMIAIYKGNVLGDQENLHSAGVNMNDTIVFVEYEKRCFTAMVGEIPIFFCKEGCGQTQRVIAMCNGKIYFFAHESLTGSENGNQCKLFYQQPYSLPAQPGLRLCPDPLRTHIPISPSSPAISSASQNTDTYTMCKSKSIPQFISAVNSPMSKPQLQSSSVNKSKGLSTACRQSTSMWIKWNLNFNT